MITDEEFYSRTRKGDGCVGFLKEGNHPLSPCPLNLNPSAFLSKETRRADCNLWCHQEAAGLSSVDDIKDKVAPSSFLPPVVLKLNQESKVKGLMHRSVIKAFHSALYYKCFISYWLMGVLLIDALLCGGPLIHHCWTVSHLISKLWAHRSLSQSPDSQITGKSEKMEISQFGSFNICNLNVLSSVRLHTALGSFSPRLLK